MMCSSTTTLARWINTWLRMRTAFGVHAARKWSWNRNYHVACSIKKCWADVELGRKLLPNQDEEIVQFSESINGSGLVVVVIMKKILQLALLL